jgi:hypothetical protein
MWNSKKCAAMAIVGAGLAMAAAPAAACGGYYGAAYGGYGGSYGAAYTPVYGSAGCGSYGAVGTYAYGWPYQTNIGSDWGAYGYAGSCGDNYRSSYTSYGYAPGYSYAPVYGYAGYGCGRAQRVRGYGFAVASDRPHRPYAVAAARQVQSKIVYRSDLKTAHAE